MVPPLYLRDTQKTPFFTLFTYLRVSDWRRIHIWEKTSSLKSRADEINKPLGKSKEKIFLYFEDFLFSF